MRQGARTKAQQAGVKDPRRVFLSWTEDEFSRPVHDSLRGKLYGRVDAFDRPIEMVDERPGLAGDRAALVPWDSEIPTDIVVLLSDTYIPKYVSGAPIVQNGCEHHLNVFLRLRKEANGYECNVWFGVVQETEWRRVRIEGRRLEDFADEMHLLLDGKGFSDDPLDRRVLDRDAQTAAKLLTEHPPTGCSSCRQRAPARAMSGGLFSYVFRKLNR